MKIFTIFLGYLTVAAHLYHTVLASPASLVARREGDIMQQHNDTLMNQDHRQFMEIRQGDPELFNISVYLVVSATGYGVIQQNPTMDPTDLAELFIHKVVDICARTWPMWNFAVVNSEFTVHSQNWGWSQNYFPTSNGTQLFTVIYLQNGTVMNRQGTDYFSAYSINAVSSELSTYDRVSLWLTVQFNPPSPEEVLATGIRADVEAVITTVGNDVAASASQLAYTQPKVFAQWVVGNCSQKWSRYNWVADGTDYYSLLAEGVDGTDWGEIGYSLVPGGKDEFRDLQSTYNFNVTWLKSGLYVHRDKFGLYAVFWAVDGVILSNDTESGASIIRFTDPTGS